MDALLFAQRRKQLAQKIGEDAIAILTAHRIVKRDGDTPYRFRQNSHFYYLTGFCEPDAVLVIQGGNTDYSILFSLSKNAEEARWIGERLGQEEACARLKVHQAFPIHCLEMELPKLCQDKKKIYYPMGITPIEPLILKIVSPIQTRLRYLVPIELASIIPLLSEMRLLKSPEEITCIKKAVDVSVQAHLAAMRKIKHAHFEYELEATLTYVFMQAGCHEVAYEPIVAGGKNACILHYTDNHAPLKPGELVLIDAACEYQHYAADITRSFPINGRFTTSQCILYELVLAAQQAALDMIKPGIFWDSIQEAIVKVLSQGLLDLKILKGSLDEVIDTQSYKQFYIHSSGHWLGLDVHDVGNYYKQKLQSNMVFTIEPGLYIGESPDIAADFWHTGIRIEDDVVVTPTGYQNLSAQLPRSVSEIEGLIQG